MNKTIYTYHPQSGAFTGEHVADESPLEPGKFLLPAFSTTLQPPETSTREIAVFDEGQWSIKADWRDVPLFSTSDGKAVTINAIGVTPTDVGATDVPMPSAAHAWKDGSWQIDTTRQAMQIEQARLDAFASIDKFHAETIQRLVGNPTQVEKDTWALKLEVATALADKAAISSAGQAFLQSAGLSADAAKLAWASSVLTKSAAYGQVVGLAERLRDAARRAAKAAHDEVALKAALDAQRAAADAAVAKLLKGF